LSLISEDLKRRLRTVGVEQVAAADPTSLSTPLLGADGDEASEAGLGGGQHKQTRLGLVTGLVLTEKAASFERVLFRATRGNMFLKLAPVDGLVKDPALGVKVRVAPHPMRLGGEGLDLGGEGLWRIWGACSFLR
jgi:V-type H+-transporting ATPase subunit a